MKKRFVFMALMLSCLCMGCDDLSPSGPYVKGYAILDKREPVPLGTKRIGSAFDVSGHYDTILHIKVDSDKPDHLGILVSMHQKSHFHPEAWHKVAEVFLIGEYTYTVPKSLSMIRLEYDNEYRMSGGQAYTQCAATYVVSLAGKE